MSRCWSQTKTPSKIWFHVGSSSGKQCDAVVYFLLIQQSMCCWINKFCPLLYGPKSLFSIPFLHPFIKPKPECFVTSWSLGQCSRVSIVQMPFLLSNLMLILFPTVSQILWLCCWLMRRVEYQRQSGCPFFIHQYLMWSVIVFKSFVLRENFASLSKNGWNGFLFKMY